VAKFKAGPLGVHFTLVVADDDLTRRIKQELPDTKIILMTGYTGEANRRLAFLGGADGFLDKTALAIDLPPAIHDIVDSMR
jgi:CheY-like chemotaxis protein